MTGFASLHGNTPLGEITIDLRCVNSRFLDLAVRLPEELRRFEALLRETITCRVLRGKFECSVSLKRELTNDSADIDAAALLSLKTLQAKVLSEIRDASPLRVVDILTYPGIVTHKNMDENALREALLKTLNEALDEFSASREREGEALGKVLLTYCDDIEANVITIENKMPAILASLKEKLTERLQEGLEGVLAEHSGLTKEEVTDRIHQEVTLYALKMGIDEEINRLRTHTTEVRRVLAAGGAVGRRLDFLTQEMNREANTLGSKAASIEMTDTSLALKLAIDKMREQIQNLE